MSIPTPCLYDSQKISKIKQQLIFDIQQQTPPITQYILSITRPVSISETLDDGSIVNFVGHIVTDKISQERVGVLRKYEGEAISYYNYLPLSPRFSFLNKLELQGINGTWRPGPLLAITPNLFLNSYDINYQPIDKSINARFTLEPTGFFLTIDINSNPTIYRLFCVESDYAQGVSITGSSMNLNYGVGGSLRLSTSPTGTDGNWSYFDLLGKTISWDVDLSNVPCGLNATFYSVYLQNGSQYLDACATNPATTELDFMEANLSSWHTTFHSKNNDCGGAPPLGYGGTINDPRYEFVDLSGVQKNPTLLYGPGDQYVINTLLPFHASIALNTTAGVLSSVVLTLTQGLGAIGQSYTTANEQYPGWLAQIGTEIVNTATSGNVLVWSVWTGGLDWLESPPCSANAQPTCTSTSCQFTISNTSIQ
uniref:Uncharacterized protein n=1 Tax=viral metagenome TaxID=1070528 RepID=A0A6C0K4R1_9ZZZZ